MRLNLFILSLIFVAVVCIGATAAVDHGLDYDSFDAFETHGRALRKHPDPCPIPEFKELKCGILDMHNATARREAVLEHIRCRCHDQVFPNLVGIKFIASPTHNLLMALNPKAMSSTSKLIVSQIDGVQLERARYFKAYLETFPPQVQGHLIRDALRGTFVRHPLRRLRSAWSDKFLRMATTLEASGYSGCEACATWVREARRTLTGLKSYTGDPSKLHGVDALKELTWERFVEAIATGVLKGDHFSPLAGQRFCRIRPDFIGFAESSSSDIEALISRLNLDPTNYTELHGNSNANNHSSDKLSDLFPDEALYEKLVKRYWTDFEW